MTSTQRRAVRVYKKYCSLYLNKSGTKRAKKKEEKKKIRNYLGNTRSH